MGSNLTGILIRGKCHTTSEAESGEMQLHAKECQGLTASTRSQEKARKELVQCLRRSTARDTMTLDFKLPEL